MGARKVRRRASKPRKMETISMLKHSGSIRLEDCRRKDWKMDGNDLFYR